MKLELKLYKFLILVEYFIHTPSALYEDTSVTCLLLVCISLMMEHIGPKHVGDYNNM